jgi:hypothetical protein
MPHEPHISTAQSARLNVFQRLAMQWERLHPYNAAQVLRLAGPAPSAARVRTAWDETLAALGLGAPVPRGSRYSWRPVPEAARAPRFLNGPTTLDAVISAELNFPYDDGACPFRPVVVTPDRSPDYYLGVGYRHWVADSVAVRLLLRHWLARITGETPLPPPELHGADGYWRLFGPGGESRWSLTRADVLLCVLPIALFLSIVSLV